MHTKARFTLITVFMFVLAMGALGISQLEPGGDNPSHTRVIFLVRHADTDPDAGRDPDLTAAGKRRAQHLAATLADQTLDTIFVTNTKRSHQTAQPAADAMDIDPTLYPSMDADALAKSIRENKADTTTLIVAHSNTVPMILKALGGEAIDNLAHNEFNRLFTVILKDGQHVKTIELRY